MSDCIRYKGAVLVNGYGRYRYKGRMQLAHRVAYCEANDVDISSIAGMVIMHSCDNPICINPNHLSLGRNIDNVNDMIKKGRKASTAGELHPLSRLTESDVHDIRRRYVRYSRTSGSGVLAREYGMTESNILDIVSGKRWSHVK